MPRDEDLDKKLRTFLDHEERLELRRQRQAEEMSVSTSRILAGMQELGQKMEVRFTALEHRVTGVEARQLIVETKLDGASIKPRSVPPKSSPVTPHEMARELGLEPSPTGTFKRVDESLLQQIADKLAEKEAEQRGAEFAREEAERERVRAEQSSDRMRRWVTFWIGLAVVAGGLVSWLLANVTIRR